MSSSSQLDKIADKLSSLYENADAKKIAIATGTAGTIYYLFNRLRQEPGNCIRVNYNTPIPGIPRFLSDIILGFDQIFFGFNDLYVLNRDNAIDYDAQAERMLSCLPEKSVWMHIPATPPFIQTTDPRNVKHILNDKFSNYKKGEFLRGVLRDLLGDGIFNADDENWKQQRKIASYAFTQNIFKDFMFGVMMRHIEDLGSLLKKHAGKEVEEKNLQENFRAFSEMRHRKPLNPHFRINFFTFSSSTKILILY